MNAITAADCTPSKKVAVPDNLNCSDEVFNFSYYLEKYLYTLGADKISQVQAAVTAAENSQTTSNGKINARTTAIKNLVGAQKESELWAKYQAENKNKMSNDAINLLKNKKQALTMTLCTNMFTHPNANASRDNKCESDTSGEYAAAVGYHAVAVIGAKCMQGKLKYLIQNSWGDWNDIKEVKNSDGSSHYEAENGKAWFDEDELTNNSFGYQKIQTGN